MSLEKTIRQCSTEELQAEIIRRKNKKARRPQPLKEKYILEIAEKECLNEINFRKWISEAALEAIYGKTIWEWRNKS